MHMANVETLDATMTWWVPSVTAPGRDWAGAPGCRRGARFLIDEESCRPARNNGGAPSSPGRRDGRPTIPCFKTRAACLEWIMAHRARLTRTAPGATVAPVSLARWLLGLS